MKVTLDAQGQRIFEQMAKEAKISTRDLAEVACYNIIALYLAEKQAAPSASAPDLSKPV